MSLYHFQVLHEIGTELVILKVPPSYLNLIAGVLLMSGNSHNSALEFFKAPFCLQYFSFDVLCVLEFHWFQIC